MVINDWLSRFILFISTIIYSHSGSNKTGSRKENCIGVLFIFSTHSFSSKRQSLLNIFWLFVTSHSLSWAGPIKCACFGPELTIWDLGGKVQLIETLFEGVWVGIATFFIVLFSFFFFLLFSTIFLKKYESLTNNDDWNSSHENLDSWLHLRSLPGQISLSTWGHSVGEEQQLPFWLGHCAPGSPCQHWLLDPSTVLQPEPSITELLLLLSLHQIQFPHSWYLLASVGVWG